MKTQALFVARYITAGSFTLIIIFGLFWLMQHLINIADRKLDEDDPGPIVDIVRVPPEEEVKRPPPPPPPIDPQEQPPEPELEFDEINPDTTSIEVSSPGVDTGIEFEGHGPDTIFGEGDYLPLAIVQPVYPTRAIARNIQGHVIVELTVTKAGTTRDIKVVEAVPPGIFDKAALAAAAKFKYKPRVIDGQPIEVSGVRYQLTFELED